MHKIIEIEKNYTRNELKKWMKPGYHLHHINTNELDNRLSNLIQLPISIHYNIHKQLQKIRTKLGLNRLEFIKYIDEGKLKFHRYFLFYYE